MCKEYENQLKEALNELSSIQMVNKLLQKELLLLTTPEINLDCNANNGIPNANANSKWSLVTAKTRKGKLKKHGVGETVKTGHFLDTSNRYTPLTKEPTDREDTIPVIVNGVYLTKGGSKARQHTSGTIHTNKVKGSVPSKCSRRKKKILILGDSHTRGLAEEVQLHIGKDFAVQALVKPGANIEAILHSTNSEVNNLTKHDVCIIWGGIRDVAKNETNWGLRQLMNFTGGHRHTSFMLMEVPHQYDLEMKSCVNKEITVFNSKLKHLNERISNLRVIDVTTDREMFTRHGFHMNQMGKEQTAVKIATEVSVLSQGNKSDPIVLQWKEEEAKKRSTVDVVEGINASDTEDDKLEPPGNSNSNSTSSDLGMLCSPGKSDETLNLKGSKFKLGTKDIEEPTTSYVRTTVRQKQLPTMDYSEAQEDAQTAPRTSYRLKKTPVTMNEDFLWTTGFRNREH
jgi:hypothetical protein